MRADLNNVDPVMVGTAPAEDELVIGIQPGRYLGTGVEMPMEENFLW